MLIITEHTMTMMDAQELLELVEEWQFDRHMGSNVSWETFFAAHLGEN